MAWDYLRPKLPSSTTASFVGRDGCVPCHAEQTASFVGSHHDDAMDLATDRSVLGDFDAVAFTHDDVVSRLYRDGERFMIRTEGPDGNLHDYQIKYTLGVFPLQQYMVELDGCSRPGSSEP